MIYRWIGAGMVIAGCGGVGFSMAFTCKRQEQLLQQLIQLISFMERELQYRLTPLPELCFLAGQSVQGILKRICLALAQNLETQTTPNAGCAMDLVLGECQDIPQELKTYLSQLGKTLGRFDLSGQLQGLSDLRKLCQERKEKLVLNNEERRKSYRTLGLCAGGALVILLV